MRHDKKAHLMVMGSMRETLEVALAPRIQGLGKASRTSEANDRWDCGVGFDGAVDMVRGMGTRGFGAKMLARTRAISAALQGKVDTVALAERFDVAGDFPDVGRFVAGDPECMVRINSPTPAKRIKLYVECCVSGGITAEQYMERGAAICAAIDSLTRKGRNVELHWQWTCPGKFAMQGPIKAGSGPLDIDLVAFTLGHPAFFRRILFALLEQFPDPDVTNHTRYGYGSVPHENKYGKPHVPADAYYIGPDESDFDNAAEFVAQLVSNIEKGERRV